MSTGWSFNGTEIRDKSTRVPEKRAYAGAAMIRTVTIERWRCVGMTKQGAEFKQSKLVAQAGSANPYIAGTTFSDISNDLGQGGQHVISWTKRIATSWTTYTES